MAFLAAALIKSGVLKSGSPKLKLMMSFPCAFNSRAKAAIARVWDVVRLLIRSDNGFIGVLCFEISGKDSPKIYANWGFLPNSFKWLKCEITASRMVLNS